MRNNDTCDWCGKSTNSLQKKPGRSFGLCPSCCPDIDEEEVPDNAPRQWHFMSENERQSWRDGMTIKEIREEYNWREPPTYNHAMNTQ